MANDCTEPLSLLPSEVARLVLGYLRDTDCKTSYESFLNSSPFLQECRHLMSTGRTFRTQVMGLELVDILNQYLEIDALVQTELKKRDPDYAGNTQNYGNLLEKLKHLLNASASRQKLFLSITVPSSKSPQKSLPHTRKRHKLVKTTSQDDTDPSVSEATDSNAKQDSVEATALTSLPGTVQRASADVDHSPTKHCLVSPARNNDTDNTPKRIPDETFNHYSKSDNETAKEKEMKNKEIKPVIGTTKNQQQLKSETNHTVSSSLSMALDDAMETIARDNVDPVFDRFLGDIIGPVASRINNDYEEKNTNNQSQYVENVPSKIDDQNAAAIESIIQMNSVEAVSATSPTQDSATPSAPVIVTTRSSGLENLTTVEPATKSVDVPSTASLGNAIAEQIAITTQQPVPQNHIIGLPNNMLLGPVSTPATLLPTSENHVFLVNNNATMSQPIVIHSAPFQLPTRTYISEQELLSMPTVILCEEGNPSTSFVQQPIVCSTMPNGLYTKPVKRPRDLAPKKPPDCKTKLLKRGASKSTTDSNILLTGKGNQITQFTAQDQASNIQYNITVTQAEPQFPTGNIPPQTKFEPLAKGECIAESDADKIKDPQAKILTPKGTRSHIRALDFSSPPKQSPKSSNRPLRGTNSSKVRLFTSPDIPSVPIATRSPMMKLSGDWDGVQGADLIFRTDDHNTNKKASEENLSTQQTIQQSSPTQSTSKEIKQKLWDEDLRTLAGTKPTVVLSDCIKNRKQKPKRKKSIEKNVVKDVMNSTETDAEEIEKQLAALEDVKVKESSISKTKSKRTTKQSKVPVKKNVKRGRKPMKQRNDENCPDEEKLKSSTSESSSPSKPVKVLSLPKMNANKTTLDINLKEPVMEDILLTSTPDIQSKYSDLANPAPEMGPANTWNPMTCLQTPGKNIAQSTPVTPSIDTPFFQTPFQKIYRENFGSVDISSIPTPSIPLTPFCDDPTFETRPTDYSNSSSYYQPSDTEQNQKIENALVEEHIKMQTYKLLEKSKSPNESITLHESSGSDANITVLPINSRYSLRTKSKTEQQVRSKIVNRERKSKAIQKSRTNEQSKLSDNEKIVKMKRGKVVGTKRGRKRQEKQAESSKSEECITPSPTISDRQMSGGSSRDIGEEEIPRLQVSDDDVTGERSKSNTLLNELKERGIILMANKTTDNNDILLEKSANSPCKENTATTTNHEHENIVKTDETEEQSRLPVCDKIESITIDEKCSSSDEKLLLSNPEFREFDVKTITDDSEEYVKINQTSTCKKVTDYNMELLKKNINANVYLEHIDTNIIKILAITPVVNLLSVESGKKASSTEFMRQLTEPTPPLSDEKEKFVLNVINIDVNTDVEADTKSTTHSSTKPILRDEEITECILQNNDNCEDVEVSEDQLFSYAITCGKRHADQSPTEATMPKRRKTPAPDKPVQNKPKNSRALLRWYGLDSLLSKVHGPSS